MSETDAGHGERARYDCGCVVVEAVEHSKPQWVAVLPSCPKHRTRLSYSEFLKVLRKKPCGAIAHTEPTP